MKRITILLSKNLAVGQACNAAAVLAGALASIANDIHDQPFDDAAGIPNTAVRYSHVLLKGGEGQILNLVRLLSSQSAVQFVVFSRQGQELFHSAFDEYKRFVEDSATLSYIGVGMIGDAAKVGMLTRKFSLL